MDQQIKEDFGQRLRDKLTQLTGDPRAAALANMLGANETKVSAPAPSSALFTLFSRMTEAAEIVTQSDRLARAEHENKRLSAAQSDLGNQAAEIRSILARAAEGLGFQPAQPGQTLATPIPQLAKFIDTRLRQLKAISDGVRKERTEGVIESIARFVNDGEQRNQDVLEKARSYDEVFAKLAEFGDDECTVEQKIEAMEAAMHSSQKDAEAAARATESTRTMYENFKRAIEVALEIDPVGLGQIVSHIQDKLGVAEGFRHAVCRALGVDGGRTDAFILEMIVRLNEHAAASGGEA